jgi:hypothetical protein
MKGDEIIRADTSDTWRSYYEEINNYEKTDIVIFGMHDLFVCVRTVEKDQHCRERQGQNRHGFDNA